jgi:acyl carrier protein
MRSKVIKILEEILEIKIAKDASTDNISVWDSLNQIRIILEIEDVFNLKVNFDDISKLTSLDTIVSYLKKNI